MEKRLSTAPIFTAACAGMSFFGVTMLSLGPILGPLNAMVEGANALPSTMSVGIIIGTILFGPIVDKFGYKWLLILASLFALAGVKIGKGCVIGTNSVVTKDIPDFSIAVGSPARVIKSTLDVDKEYFDNPLVRECYFDSEVLRTNNDCI